MTLISPSNCNRLLFFLLFMVHSQEMSQHVVAIEVNVNLPENGQVQSLNTIISLSIKAAITKFVCVFTRIHHAETIKINDLKLAWLEFAQMV